MLHLVQNSNPNFKIATMTVYCTRN